MTTHEMSVFGTVKVGGRGQIVVPSSARRSMDIKPGDRLLVVSTPSKDGLALIKVEIVRDMIEKMSSGLTSLEEEGSGKRRASNK
ncbi:MAG: AbrB/MazE/SpoVT family DNA-binding domain-containing protein [Thermoplasmata archaeon]|jgi:AbrB family looped-hinge helix DNA binding protein|nr:AbrB/MazE/SpoVT family DNA-binding domain-containing protein [Thermoplasmata archaeon]